MSEFEYLEAIQGNWDLIRSSAMDFVTLLFAYTVVVHLAGERLSRYVAIGLTCVYSLFLLGPFSLLIGTAIAQSNLIGLAYEDYTSSGVFEGDTPNGVWFVALAFGPSAVGYLFSVWYMHAIVRKRA